MEKFGGYILRACFLFGGFVFGGAVLLFGGSWKLVAISFLIGEVLVIFLVIGMVLVVVVSDGIDHKRYMRTKNET